jgi:hypothetical protein
LSIEFYWGLGQNNTDCIFDKNSQELCQAALPLIVKIKTKEDIIINNLKTGTGFGTEAHYIRND